MKLTLTIDLDDARWFTLADRADAAGVKVEGLLEAEVRAVVARMTRHEHPVPRDTRGPNPYTRDAPWEDQVHRDICRRMWVAGHSSVAIAKRLGTTNVRKVRATLWQMGFDTRARIGRPHDGTRPRPVHLTIEQKAAIAS